MKQDLVKLPAPVASGSQNVHAKWGGPHVAIKKKKSLITGNRVKEISKNGTRMSVCNRTFVPTVSHTIKIDLNTIPTFLFCFFWGLLRRKATVATSCVGVALTR